MCAIRKVISSPARLQKVLDFMSVHALVYKKGNVLFLALSFILIL